MVAVTAGSCVFQPSHTTLGFCVWGCDVGQERVVGGVGRGHDGRVADPEDGLVGVAPHGAALGVVAQSGPPLPVDQSGAEVDVSGADLAGLIRPLLVRGDALREVGVGTRVSNRRGGTHDEEES